MSPPSLLTASSPVLPANWARKSSRVQFAPSEAVSEWEMMATPVTLFSLSTPTMRSMAPPKPFVVRRTTVPASPALHAAVTPVAACASDTGSSV